MIIIPLPARRPRTLCTFDNCYRVAVNLRESTGVDQFVVRTDNPHQPFRVTRFRPHNPEMILAMVA